MIAALFVETNGAYYGLEGVDPWDEKRDARLYDGPYPVVAHPPCSRWCRLAGLVEARWGHKKGDDGGCFASALRAVREHGGVLEHPAHSAAWLAHGLFEPTRSGGWSVADWDGGWTCYVEQGRYGHPVRKATWLYAKGCELPSLTWGATPDTEAGSASWCGPLKIPEAYGTLRAPTGDGRPRVGAKAGSETPPAFREVLLSMARSVGVEKP